MRALTPLLDEPLQGPVYLRSSSHPLPDMVLALYLGKIEIEAVGRIDSVNGGIRATFDSIPDAPITKVVLRMQGARKGLIVNSTEICARTQRAEAALRRGTTESPAGPDLASPPHAARRQQAEAQGGTVACAAGPCSLVQREKEMLTPLRTKFGVPGVISIIALVFAMIGGAYAASDGGQFATASKSKKNSGLTKNQKKEVESIAKKYQGTGPSGAVGPPGPAGASGGKGPIGPEGPRGASRRNWLRSAAFPLVKP